jgi:hypothetical protein
MRSSIFLSSLAVILAIGSANASQNGMVRRHHSKLAARNAASTPETHTLQKRSFQGKATFYGMSSGDQGACGDMLDSSEFTVALNEVQYGSLNSVSSYCGKTITITNGVKTAQAKITDACPTGVQCHYGALDMSTSLFKFFNPMDVGVFDITWWIGGSGGGSSKSSDDSSSDDSSSSSSSSHSHHHSSASKSSSDDSSSSSSSAAAASSSSAAAHEELVHKAKKAAAKKAEEKAKKAAKKAAAEKKKKAAEKKKKAEAKIKGAQEENVASFGEIMQSLNNMVENAMDDGTSSKASSAAPAAATTAVSVAVAATVADSSSTAAAAATTIA